MTEVGDPIQVCPACSHPDIVTRVRDHPRYRCGNCTATFNTPRVRERKGDSTGGSGGPLPAKLASMTPGEFDDLRTDGGGRRE